MRILAIDFETANPNPSSACAIGAVLADREHVLYEYTSLIRPPTQWFAFTPIHGLRWPDCEAAPAFPAVWDEVLLVAQEADVLVAHNASFDFGVIRACCRHYRLPPPAHPFACSVRLARQAWGLPANGLAALSERFGIALNHHEALSDARACALIVQRLMNEGYDPRDALISRGHVTT
ncbi:MAG TPA: exonuclease [Alphaproteobacteria bacterium]|nr:exonuclease [Alphaproteobacteria bacterium]HAJ47333.1 exonuclease [Alphaproteobacteria bacterium]